MACEAYAELTEYAIRVQSVAAQQQKTLISKKRKLVFKSGMFLPNTENLLAPLEGELRLLGDWTKQLTPFKRSRRS